MASGQPTPPVLVAAFANDAPDSAPGPTPIPGGKTNPFPVTSQIGIVNGAASLADGFVPANMTDPTAGGVPPFGVDTNGILFLLSSHIAALQAGQWYEWSSVLEAALSDGYKVGAVVQQSADPNAFWINTVDGNTANPDSGTAGASGWWSTKPLHTSIAPTTGTHNDVVLPGASDYCHDVDCTAGAITITGFVAQRDGQRLTIRKVDSSGNALTLSSLTGSAAGNQFQIIAAGLSLPLQYMAVTLRYVTAITKWVQE